MGHLRVGRLPKTHNWQEVVGLLDAAPDDTAAVARATVTAAEGRLRALANDPALTYCVWLLTRLTWAARDPSFTESLATLGLPVDASASALGFIAQVADHVRTEISGYPQSGPFGELASLALRRALSETVAQQARSLFGSSIEDLQQAFRTYSTRTQFAVLAHRFFADFLSRTLMYFLDRETSNHVGPERGFATIEQSAEFTRAIDTHARQSARIMQDFAGGWYSKHNWESRGEISEQEVAGFVGVALRKLRSEVKREAQ
jgi:hypothetical protein